HPQCLIRRPSIVHGVRRDDLMLGFLNGHELAEFGGLDVLPFADRLGMWFKHAEYFVGTWTSPPTMRAPVWSKTRSTIGGSSRSRCCTRCNRRAVVAVAVRTCWPKRRTIVPASRNTA